jgi:glycosyltransferase involved in cell wall biosynthesis
MERKIGRKIDLVFFTCLYDRFLARHSRSFAWDWAGLYLQVSGFRVPNAQAVHPLRRFNTGKRSSEQLRGLGVLDEDAVEFVQQVSGCANVQLFPDFSDTTVTPNCLVADQLSRRANGRKIIGVAGHLLPSKGIVTLAEVAITLAAEDKNVLVAFVGEFWWESFEESARRTLRQAFALPNVFTHLERIPSESDFNAVLNRFDVIYACYHAFPHSSNMPAKAAGLGKPLIVSSGYLLAERTARYLLGKVIPERDVDALRKAILELINSQACLPNSEGCQEYLSLHSRQSLRESLCSLLSPIWH